MIDAGLNIGLCVPTTDVHPVLELGVDLARTQAVAGTSIHPAARFFADSTTIFTRNKIFRSNDFYKRLSQAKLGYSRCPPQPLLSIVSAPHNSLKLFQGFSRVRPKLRESGRSGPVR